MNKYYLLAGLLMAGSLAACGDEPAGSEDTGTTTEDTGVTPDGTGGEDTPEVATCGDGVINGTEVCDGTELGGAMCDGIGEFTGGSLACADDCTLDTSGCTTEAANGCDACTADQECIDDICVDAIAPADYVFSEPLSYISGIQFPSAENPCCFDMNGDGQPNNGLGDLLGMVASLAPDTDVQAQIDDAIESDSIGMMMEFHEIPDDLSTSGDAPFSIWLVTNDVDGDGTPDQDMSVRAAGDGSFQVTPGSFGEYGSLIQFRRSTVESNMLEAGPSVFGLAIPIPEIGTLDLTILDARIEGEIANSATGIVSINEDVEVDGEMITFGGGKLGGVIPLDQIFDAIEVIAEADCSCAGLPAGDIFFEYGEDEETMGYAFSCNENMDGDACTDDENVVCANLGSVCSYGGLLGSLLDVDTNDNAINDAYGVGLYLTMTGASLATPPVAP